MMRHRAVALAQQPCAIALLLNQRGALLGRPRLHNPGSQVKLRSEIVP
jgi:hypothetical protein